MNEVFRSYIRSLEQEFNKIDLFSSAGKNRYLQSCKFGANQLCSLLGEVRFFVENFSNLDGIDGPGSQLEVIVNNVKIKDRRSFQQQQAAKAAAAALNDPKKNAPPPPKSAFGMSFGKMLRNNDTSG